MSNMSELMAVMRIELNAQLLKRDERCSNRPVIIASCRGPARMHTNERGFRKLQLGVCPAGKELNQNVRRIREVLRHQGTQFSWLEAMVQVSARALLCSCW